jgi:CheY-like chemotaxis protein
VTIVESDNLSAPEDGLLQQPHGSIEDDRKQISTSNKIVLIIDDDPDLLEATSFALESEGFDIETARHGEEGLQRLRMGDRPAVVLLDLMMPVMNGWQFLEEVAKFPSLNAIPIVVLTAARAEVSGAAEVLRKPVDLGLLIGVLERYARGAG